MNRLTGKVAVVTGAALGLGRATALRMAEQGAAVALTDVREDDGQAFARDLAGRGLQARFWRHDVSDEAETAPAEARLRPGATRPARSPRPPRSGP